MALDLSERQKATIAAAVTVVAVVVVLAAAGACLYALGWFFARFAGVFMPVAVAGMLALVLKPFYDRLVGLPRVAPWAAVSIVFVSLFLPLVLLSSLVGTLLVRQILDLIEHAPEIGERAAEIGRDLQPEIARYVDSHPWARRVFDGLQAEQSALLQDIERGLTDMGGAAISAGRRVLDAIGSLLSWVVMPVYLAFFLMANTPKLDPEGQTLLPFLKPSTRADVVYLAREFVNILVAFFRGQILIAFLQGILFATGFGLVGLDYGLLIGLVLGFLNVVPYLGNVVGLGVALPLAYFQPDGGTTTLVAVLVVFAVVQVLEGYVLTPRIMGDRTGLHPMVIIIAIFFWGSALDGIAGMILAIPLTAFLVVFWRLAREKYIAEIV